MDLFTFYGVDVAVLGIVTSALTQILKATLFKKAPNKIYTFLPFILGIIIYVFYAAATHTSFDYVLENFARIAERGLSVGAAATMVYVIYEQFVRGKPAKNAVCLTVAAILEGYVGEEKRYAVAQNIVEGFDGTNAELAEKAVERRLESEAAGEISAEEIRLLSLLIVRTLAQLNTSAAG